MVAIGTTNISPASDDFPIRGRVDPHIRKLLSDLNGVTAWARQNGEQDREVNCITGTLKRLYALLAEEPFFQTRLAAARTGAVVSPDWVTLYQGDGARLGLIAIPEQTPVSFHDHPDTSGVMLLLSGRISVLTCGLSARTNDRSAMLEVVSNREMGPGETASVTPGSANIHRLQSLDRCSIAIDLLVEGRNSIPRNWYFPLDNDRVYRSGESFPTTTLTDWRGIR